MEVSMGLNIKEGISVIVPFFNCERYLAECVNSILNQSYRNIEALLIDDGSTDGSYKLALQFAELDQRVKVFHKENQGCAAARNYGIQEAEGKYITFVDADDTIEPEYCGKLYEQLTDSSDYIISICGYARLDERGIKIPVNEDLKEYDKESDQLYDTYLLDMFKTKKIFGTCWRSLIPKKLLTECSVAFPRCLLSEDQLFFLKVLGCCDGIKVCRDSLYNYRSNPSSITMNRRYINGLLADRLVYIEELQSRLKLCRLNMQEYEEIVDYAILTFRMVLFFNASFGPNRKAENKEIAKSVFCKRQISPVSTREWKNYQNKYTKTVFYLTERNLYGVLAMLRNLRKSIRKIRIDICRKK